MPPKLIYGDECPTPGRIHASRPLDLFKTPPVSDDIQHGFEVYKRRNASALFVAWDDRWNDTENDLNNNGYILFL